MKEKTEIVALDHDAETPSLTESSRTTCSHELSDLLDNDLCSDILRLSRNRATAIMKEAGAFEIAGGSTHEWRIWKQDLLAWLEEKSKR
jgi:hypothetical protein